MATGTSTSGGVRIGELASAAGLTVRTLHYYEEAGLLVPSTRTASGHRLYAQSDVDRLYRIGVLKRLGLPLAAVRLALEDPDWDVRAAMAKQLAEVERRLSAGSRLRATLRRFLTAPPAGPPTGADALDLLDQTTMFDDNVQRRISVLIYEDLEAAVAFLESVFLLGPGTLSRDQDGAAVHGEIQAGDGVVWLHPESAGFGLSSPRRAGAATGMTVILVDDVDAHHQHVATAKGDVVYGPVDQPYGYREYTARDPEGHLWSFMKATD
jgi:DNA-binding transcriptional MerR regulator